MERLAEKIRAVLGVAPANRTATTVVNGTGVARNEAAEVVGVCYAGAMGDDSDCVFKLQQSDNDSDYTDITDATCTFDADDDNAVQLISARPTKKYVRGVIDPGGSGVANGVLTGMVLEFYGVRSEPVDNDPDAVLA